MADYPIKVQVTIDGKRVYNNSVVVGIFIYNTTTEAKTFFPLDLTDDVVTTVIATGASAESQCLTFATKDATTFGDLTDDSYSFDGSEASNGFPDYFDSATALDTSKGWKSTVGDYAGIMKSIEGRLHLNADSTPIVINFTGGTSSVDVSYTASKEFTVSPVSPIHIASTDVTLSVTLIDGYVWKTTSQKIVIDSHEITGTVTDKVCSFILNSSNVGSGGNITWNLDYEVYVPPVVKRTDFFTVYIPTNENMKTINNTIFISTGGDAADVLKYFSSYKKFFCNIPIEGYKELKANKYDFGVTSPYTNTYKQDIDCGRIQINETFKSIMDYTPFSRLTIFLPFVGFQELDSFMVMNKELHVVYTVDVLSGRCLAKLYVVIGESESCIVEYAGNIASDEVFSTGNQYNTGYELLTSLQLGELQPFVLISTKEPLEGNVAEYDGLPSNEVKKVKDCSGYIRYNFINASGCRGTDAEKAEIENLLKSGINANTAGSGTGS